MVQSLVTIPIEEYDYLQQCKRRAESTRAATRRWIAKNRDHVNELQRINWKKRKERKNG